jgi:murein DD-endopeptidase MepM/ murein hydrolase activator NlpD
LQDQKSALADQIAAEKDTENERDRIAKAQLDQQKQVADDALAHVKEVADAQKQAADDELARIKAELDARKRTADDSFKVVQDELAKRKDAADAELQLVKNDVAARKQAEDDKLKATLDRLDKEKQAADDALKAEQDRLSRERTDADDALKLAKDRIDDEIRAEDDKLSKIKDRLDKRKVAVEDANKTELDGIAKRKQAESDAHDDAVTKAHDVAEQAKRAVQDRRLAEDEADKAKRQQVADTYKAEQDAIKATYDDQVTGVIPALHRASDAAQTSYGVRKQAADDAYKAEQEQIRLTYDDPVDGIIAKLRGAAKEAQDRYGDRKQAVNDAYNAEKDRIKEVYDDPVTGLFRKLADAKQNTIDSLNDQVEKWRNWKRDVTKEIADATKDLDEFIKKVGGLDNIGVVPTAKPGEPGGPAGPAVPPGFDPGGNDAYAPVVRGASDASYWTSGGTHGGHPAADIFADKGTPIYAPVGGTSSPAAYPLGGNSTILTGDDGRAYYFAHGNRAFEGGRVSKGEQIGEVGNTGNASGGPPHLHFAISTQGAGLFGQLNGSGDVTGDSSWWKTGAPMEGAVSPGAPDDEITVTVQGRQITFRRKGGGDFVGPNGDDNPEFQRLLAAARKAASEYDLPAAIMAAIPINEGRFSELQTKYHNIFSIKGTGPAGSVVLPTEEVLPGVGRVTVQSPFRVYHDESESFEDFGKLITQSGIYDDAYAAWKAHHNATEFMELLGHHYATDPNFPRQVLKIAGYAGGTVISEPTLLAGLHTGSLGIAGETGAPERLLGVSATAAYEARNGGGNVTVDLRGAQSFDGHKFEDLMVRVLSRADLRGRLTFLQGPG